MLDGLALVLPIEHFHNSLAIDLRVTAHFFPAGEESDVAVDKGATVEKDTSSHSLQKPCKC